MILVIGVEKGFDGIQLPFMIKKKRKKTTLQLGIEGTQLTIATYEKLTAKIILNGERLKMFSLNSGPRQGCLLLP